MYYSRACIRACVCVCADFLLELLLSRLMQLYLHCRYDASILLCFYVVGFKTCPIVAVKVRLNSAQFISPYLSLPPNFILTCISRTSNWLYAKSSVIHIAVLFFSPS